MPRRKGEIIFEAYIDDRRSNYPLTENSKAKDDVERILKQELPKELNSIFDIEVSVEIKGVRNGSLSVFYFQTKDSANFASPFHFGSVRCRRV